MLLLGAGCGSPSPATTSPRFDGAPLVMLASSGGHYAVAVRTDPSPPLRGIDAAEYAILDGEGRAAAGVTLNVTPWMPDMGHGTSIAPMVTATGDGTFVIERVSLYMAGRWQLRSRIEGAVTDDVAPEFQVE